MKLTNKHYFHIFTSLAGLALLVMTLSTSQIENYFTDSQNSLGSINDIRGQVDIISSHRSSPLRAHANQKLHHLDTVITHRDSKALLGFTPQAWLMPFSKIEIQNTENGIIGRLIYGELKTIDRTVAESQTNITYIHKNKTLEGTTLKSNEDSPLLALDLKGELEDIDGDNNSSPRNQTDQQIFQTLSLHKRFFQNCLVKHYRASKGNIKGGETLFSLVITPNGVIEKIKITRSASQDKKYQGCLSEVLARVQFKNLKIKEPLHALFPLNIEL